MAEEDPLFSRKWYFLILYCELLPILYILINLYTQYIVRSITIEKVRIVHHYV
jgi:hypothetical protein